MPINNNIQYGKGMKFGMEHNITNHIQTFSSDQNFLIGDITIKCEFYFFIIT